MYKSLIIYSLLKSSYSAGVTKVWGRKSKWRLPCHDNKIHQLKFKYNKYVQCTCINKPWNRSACFRLTQ